MRFETTAAVLATLSVATASQLGHSHMHGKLHHNAQKRSQQLQRDAGVIPRGLESRDLSLLSSLGALFGSNPTSSNGQAWIAPSGGDYSNCVSNDSGDNIIVTVWGPLGSWINSVAPIITQSLAPGDNVTLQYANGFSGAMSAFYPDTQLINGQLSNTWLEHTFSGDWTTVDVSREVNMAGHSISMTGTGPSGQSCTTDMTTCVFTCINGQDTCWEAGSYQLQNCDAANGGGSDAAAMNGGCNNMPVGSTLSTIFGS